MKTLKNLTADMSDDNIPAPGGIRQGAHYEHKPGLWVNLAVVDGGFCVRTHKDAVIIPRAEILALLAKVAPGFLPPYEGPSKPK